jgi:hypothetical protein
MTGCSDCYLASCRTSSEEPTIRARLSTRLGHKNDLPNKATKAERKTADADLTESLLFSGKEEAVHANPTRSFIFVAFAALL